MPTPIYEEYPDYHCLSHLNPQSSDLSLFSCGIQKCPPGHTWDKARPQYHLHFIIDVKGIFQTGGNTYHLKRRQLFLCPPDTPLSYSADSVEPWHYAWISFYGPKAALWLKQAGFDQDNLIRDSYIPIEQFTVLIQQLLNTWKPAPGNTLKQLSGLFHLMSLLISSNTSETQNSASSKTVSNDFLFEQALEFVADNYDCNIHVQDISRQIGYPDSQTFSKAFRRIYNISPSEYQKLHSGKSL